MVRQRDTSIVRALADRVNRRQVILAVAYLLLVVSCDSPLSPDAAGVARIDVTPPSLSMIVGETSPLTARVIDESNATVSNARVVWSSDNVSIATVSQ
ncbi:MAG: Ig-like domain-containing protein, partial [Gemmatimonadaceae bacterium]